MKNRRYFTCPIQAAYMAKYFGIEYVTFIPSFRSWEGQILELSKSKLSERFYVSLGSEAFFEPKIKDFVKSIISETTGEVFSKSPYESRVALARIGEEEGFIYRDSEVKIIMRDNKHFFMGELENEK